MQNERRELLRCRQVLAGSHGRAHGTRDLREAPVVIAAHRLLGPDQVELTLDRSPRCGECLLG